MLVEELKEELELFFGKSSPQIQKEDLEEKRREREARLAERRLTHAWNKSRLDEMTRALRQPFLESLGYE